MTASDPIREQLLEARRNQILDAAALVLAEKGFHGATTKEIAARAGVSEGTIYNYFDSKFGLLMGLMSRLSEVDHLPVEMEASSQRDVRDFFVSAFQHRLNRIEHGEGLLQAILPEVFVNPELRQQFYHEYVRPITILLEQYVESQIGLGHLRPVDVPLTVRTLQATFVGLLVLRILGDGALRTSWDQVPELLALVYFDGLSVPDDDQARGFGDRG
jgi:AcrR family transcriptional regulator